MSSGSDAGESCYALNKAKRERAYESVCRGDDATPGIRLDELIRTAIEHRRLLRFRYLNRDRIVEPHDYGIIGGSIDLFTFQVGGSSSRTLPDWRLMFVNGISDANILDLTFPRGRPQSAKHLKWDQLFLRVKPAGQD